MASASIISVVYQHCDKESTIVTSRQHQYGKRGPKLYDINARIALGAIDNGTHKQSPKLHTKTESEELARV